MPAKSQQQQKFMGLVHAYKKGEVPASKVSSAIKQAAKSMSKKSVKKYAQTDHDDLPKKVSEEKIKSENLVIEFGKSFQKFTRAVHMLGKGITKMTGDKTDERIIQKAFKKHIIPFGRLIDDWNKGQQKNPHLTTERVKDPKLKVGQKIRFKTDPRRLYKLKKITVGNVGIPDKDDPSGTSYMFVAPGNRKEYFTKKTWANAVKKGWLQLESLNERTRMKPQVKKLLKQKGYGPIFGAIDNSKRQLKQMRYSRGEIQDTLISMFGDEDPKILQKIKESINEKKGDFLDSLFPKSKVAKAVKIAHDMGGDMTGAVKKIERYFKGMTLHSKVRDALQQANESINEKKGVPGSVFTIDTAKETSELMTKALKKVAPDIKRGQIYYSDLGGADRVSIVGKFSLDPKKTWANNILENSRFITFHLDNDGTLEVNVNGYPFEMRRKVQMRKSRNNDIKQVLKRMITHFSMLNKKYPEGM